jgi:Universal stress protein UspA and related nucleotide-binding proteins
MKTKLSKRSFRSLVKPQRILVPVDFSDSSARALHHAAERAAESGGSLIIVHVVPADYGWSGIGRDESRDLDRSLQRQAADRLRAFADEHVGHNVAADLEVRIGQPAEEIVAAARESKCDSIMLSTRGLTGLDRYLIGSVADRVARLAPCPVVLVRPGKRSPDRKQKLPAVLRFKREGKSSR